MSELSGDMFGAHVSFPYGSLLLYRLQDRNMLLLAIGLPLTLTLAVVSPSHNILLVVESDAEYITAIWSRLQSQQYKMVGELR